MVYRQTERRRGALGRQAGAHPGGGARVSWRRRMGRRPGRHSRRQGRRRDRHRLSPLVLQGRAVRRDRGHRLGARGRHRGGGRRCRRHAGREAGSRHPHLRRPRAARTPAGLCPDRRAGRSRGRDGASRLSGAARPLLRARAARGHHARRLPAARSRGGRGLHRRRLHGGAGRAAGAGQGHRPARRSPAGRPDHPLLPARQHRRRGAQA